MEQFSDILFYVGLDDPVYANVDYNVFLFSFNNKCSISQIYETLNEICIKGTPLKRFLEEKIIDKKNADFTIPNPEHNRNKMTIAHLADYFNKSGKCNVIAGVSYYGNGKGFAFIPLVEDVPFKSDVEVRQHEDLVKEERTTRALHAINKKFTENDEETAVVKAGLSLWMTYFKTCHQIESEFVIKDKYFNDGIDLGNRKLIWDYEQHYRDNRLQDFKKEFNNKHPEHRKRYKRDKFWHDIIPIILYILGAGAAIGCSIPVFKVKGPLLGKITGIVLGIVVLLVVGFIMYFIAEKLGNFIKEKFYVDDLSYSEYFNKYVAKTTEYEKEINEDYSSYYKFIKEKTNFYEKQADYLYSVRTQLEKLCPLKDYGFEKSVAYCLFLLENGRASSYKEALNMFVDDEKTEKIQKANEIIASSINDLTRRVETAIASVSVGYRNATNRILDSMSNMKFKIEK